MKKNVGKTDKIIRMLLAFVLFYLAHSVVSESPWNYVLYAFGAILIFTAVLGYCGLYTLLSIKTCCKKECCENKDDCCEKKVESSEEKDK